ncbi:unnamed protein product [Cunninghamella blakesleeana]
MVVVSSQRRHFILVGTFLIFLLTISYYQYSTNTDRAVQYLSTEKQQEDILFTSSSPIDKFKTNNEPTIKKDRACDKADIPWLASDRQYWDGWGSKSFFLLPDGNFTIDNVYAEEGVELCVVVLLGPVPAPSKIKVEQHFAPPDIITMTAVGKKYSVSVLLDQYAKQNNAYYANVYLKYSDEYILKTTTEYRSYFWETPILHRYQPFEYDSKNLAIIHPTSSASIHVIDDENENLPSCDVIHHSLEGIWKNETNQFSFTPNNCNLHHTRHDGLQCLNKKTIHVWGDANMRRNLKVMASPEWCNSNDPDARCICNDDLEDPDGNIYPWATNHQIPLSIGENIIHYNSINTITLQDWRPEIRKRVKEDLASTEADIVIVNVGNDDVGLSRMRPVQFSNSLNDFMKEIVTIYPHQTIILRTPQFFGTGDFYTTSWNYGRSRAFANVVREFVNDLQHPRIFLWDTHQLGLEYNTCRYHGTLYTRRNVLDIENQLLYNLFCNYPA